MEPEIFKPEAKPATCWFIGGFIALLGALLVIAGLDKVQYDPTWMIPQILFGAAVMFLGWRTARYYKRHALILTDTAIELDPFWTPNKTIPYADIRGLGFFEQDNIAKDYTQHPAGRATGQIVTTQHLILTMKSGKIKKITLPRYDNTTLIESLQKRSGLKYQREERQFAG